MSWRREINFKKSAVSVAIVTAIGTGAAALPTTAAAVLSDGAWALTIVPTATRLRSHQATPGTLNEWHHNRAFSPADHSSGCREVSSVPDLL